MYHSSAPPAVAYPSTSSISGIQGQLLEVTVVSGTKLKSTEWISRQDPYVCLEYGSTKFRTRTCTDGGKNPTFQEKFTISLIEGLRDLKIVVWNHNTINFDDFIGTGNVRLQKVLSVGYDDSSWPLQSKSGRSSGEIRLILQYANAKKPSESYASLTPPYLSQAAPYSTPPPPHVASYPSPGSGYPAPPPGSGYPAPPPGSCYPTPSPYPSHPPNSADRYPNHQSSADRYPNHQSSADRYPNHQSSADRYPNHQSSADQYPNHQSSADRYPNHESSADQYPNHQSSAYPPPSAYPPSPYPSPSAYPPSPYPPPPQTSSNHTPGSFPGIHHSPPY